MDPLRLRSRLRAQLRDQRDDRHARIARSRRESFAVDRVRVEGERCVPGPGRPAVELVPGSGQGLLDADQGGQHTIVAGRNTH